MKKATQNLAINEVAICYSKIKFLSIVLLDRIWWVALSLWKKIPGKFFDSERFAPF